MQHAWFSFIEQLLLGTLALQGPASAGLHHPSLTHASCEQAMARLWRVAHFVLSDYLDLPPQQAATAMLSAPTPDSILARSADALARTFPPASAQPSASVLRPPAGLGQGLTGSPCSPQREAGPAGSAGLRGDKGLSQGLPSELESVTTAASELTQYASCASTLNDAVILPAVDGSTNPSVSRQVASRFPVWVVTHECIQ